MTEARRRRPRRDPRVRARPEAAELRRARRVARRAASRARSSTCAPRANGSRTGSRQAKLVPLSRPRGAPRRGDGAAGPARRPLRARRALDGRVALPDLAGPPRRLQPDRGPRLLSRRDGDGEAGPRVRSSGPVRVTLARRPWPASASSGNAVRRWSRRPPGLHRRRPGMQCNAGPQASWPASTGRRSATPVNPRVTRPRGTASVIDAGESARRRCAQPDGRAARRRAGK